jgi:DNA excision repair protein ERCC-3
MTPEFYEEYLRMGEHRIQQLLYILNPSKIRACEALVNSHAANNDKIIIFSDDIVALQLYCESLKIGGEGTPVPYIFGGTSKEARKAILNAFKSNKMKCLGLSKVGDTALDIPDANVIIQVRVNVRFKLE